MRRTPRYDASIPCVLEADDGEVVTGVVRNLSMGGAGIDVQGHAPEWFTLVLTFEGESLRLACETRHSRDFWSWRRLHAQFEALSRTEEESLARVLESLRENAAASPGRKQRLVGMVRRAMRR